MTRGELLRLCRQDRGLTLQEVAKACHTTKSYIWHLEHGDSSRIGLEMAACLCRFFGIDLCEFAGLSGETPPNFR